ncbi:hypothetical protein AB0C34_16945 [Nocardia sp. NPDC049220]|uniref:hypothetical protein n=1 Tax=Nocardia sp. NPDC049220 TaxID=3155273 RepID=UPI00340300F0
MATMHTDGTFAPAPRCLAGPECGSAVFQIEATFSRLVEALGEPDTIAEEAPDWVILVQSDDRPNERVSIHHASNWPRVEIDEPTLWYVTCYRDARWAAESLAEKLGETVEFAY